MQQNLITPQQDPAIDQIYHSHKNTSYENRGISTESIYDEKFVDEQTGHLIITNESISHFAQYFDLPPAAVANLNRAFNQIATRLAEASGPQKKQIEIDWFL